MGVSDAVTGLRVPLVSCNGDNGSICGPETVHVNNDGSWTDVNYGVLLNFSGRVFVRFHARLKETQPHLKVKEKRWM
ncbi:hypothetical protein EVA_20179 [gut metagenome]|uniref:Uncharacterized protein n=1 Tax=gut metagenome TaxID=749906 RepID=J9FQ52_9ZZZZ